METTILSTCCRADVHEYEDGNYCAYCKKQCNFDTVCAYCLGTGERPQDFINSDGNTEHGTLSTKCECTYGNK